MMRTRSSTDHPFSRDPTRTSSEVARCSNVDGTRAVLRPRAVRRCWIVACSLFAATATAQTQTQYHDYYKARLTKEGRGLLSRVEGYHLEQGVGKMKAGQYAYAYGDFDFILRYFPNHPRGLALMSELCDVKWKNPRCDTEGRFRNAIEINPRAPQTFIVNGIHLQRLNRVPEATESYKRAIALDPASASAHYNLGLIYLEQKQFELANRHAQLAYSIGMPYPGLRDKLTQAGQWKPMDADQIKRELAPPDGVPPAAPPT